MKKILMMLLCAATVALIGCNNKNNEPDPQPEPEAEKELDPNGEADCEIRFYTTDSLLLYTNYSIKDTLNPSLDCSQTTIQNFDTTNNKADAAIWSLSLRAYKIPVAQIRVIVLPVHLKVGTHGFQVNYTRNETPITAQKISHLLHVAYFTSTNSKVECSPLLSDISYAAGFKNPATNLPEFLEAVADDPFEFNLKMYK